MLGHLLGELKRNDALHGRGRCLFEETFLLEKLIKAASYIFLRHNYDLNFLSRRLASANSFAGVFCVFFINP